MSTDFNDPVAPPKVPKSQRVNTLRSLRNGKGNVRPWWTSPWFTLASCAAVLFLALVAVSASSSKSESASAPRTRSQTNRNGSRSFSPDTRPHGGTTQSTLVSNRPEPIEPEVEKMEGPCTVETASTKVVGGSAAVSETPTVVSVDPLPSATDPDLVAVRQLLKENLPTGKWEEIRWWSKRRCPGKVATPQNQNMSTLNGIWGVMFSDTSWDGRLICRLKYRTQGESGAMEVQDQVFAIEGGRIRTLPPYDDNAWLARIWHSQFPSDPY